MKNLLVAITLLCVACNSKPPNSISGDDLSKIQQLHEDYRTFWLENDSVKVVNLFSENGQPKQQVDKV